MESLEVDCGLAWKLNTLRASLREAVTRPWDFPPEARPGSYDEDRRKSSSSLARVQVKVTKGESNHFKTLPREKKPFLKYFQNFI